MLKKVLFLTLLILSITCTSYGAFLTIPCSQGGTIVVEDSFSYDPIFGNFNAEFTFNNCNEGDGTMSGSIDSSGTFVLTSATNASVDLDTTVDMTLSGGGGQGSIDCTGDTTGTYNLNTEIFTGSNALNCTTSGSVSVDLVDLLLGPISLF